MKLKLVRTEPVTHGVVSFVFEPQEPLQWQAGQYLHYVLHHRPTDERGSDRWFTVSSAPFEKTPMITTRITQEKGSTFKKALLALKVGEEIEVSAVEGDFIFGEASRPYVFIAGGIGITPFYSILKQAQHDGIQPQVTLIYGNRDEHIPFKEQFDAWAAQNPGLKIHYIVPPATLDAATITSLVTDFAAPIFYVSGPEPMVEALGKTLKDLGVADERLKQDWFPGYEAP